MSDEKVIIEFDLNTDKVKPALKTTERVFKKSGKTSGKKFSKGFSSSIKGLTSNMFNLKTAVLSIGSAIGAAFATGKLIQAANVQEDAIKKLNTSLMLTGKLSKETSQDLQAYASELQNVTAFGDEATLSVMGLIQSMGNLSTGTLKEATRVTQDFSAAMGIDFQAAAALMGKAAAGEVTALNRYGFAFKKTGDKAADFNEVLKQVGGKFGGSAAAAVTTFSGRTQQLSNTFGDLLESLGFLITKNDKVKNGLLILTKGFSKLITYIDQNSTAMMLLVSNGFTRFLKGSASIIGVIGEITKGFQTASNMIDKFNNMLVNNAEIKALSKLRDEAVKNDLVREADKYQQQIDLLKNHHEEQNTLLDKQLSDSMGRVDQFTNSITQIATDMSNAASVSMTINMDTKGVSKAVNEVNKAQKAIDKSFVDMGKAAIKGLGGGVASGFAAMGKAIANGENALEAFGKAFFNAIAQMAIQQGTAFIMQGIGYQFVPGMQGVGSGLIAAGAGLATFGGVLSALAGGGGGSAAGTAGATGDVGATPDYTADNESLEEVEERQSSVVVNIQGDVLDSQESGLRIVDIINEAVTGQNVTITQRAFA